jgi:hypothetical protein
MNSVLRAIWRAILAVYNFFVGDAVILIGVSLTMVVLAMINFLGGLASLRGASGAILIVGVVATLLVTLRLQRAGVVDRYTDDAAAS